MRTMEGLPDRISGDGRCKCLQMEWEHSFEAEPRQAVKDNSLLILQLWCQLWMPLRAGNASLTLLWLCGSSGMSHLKSKNWGIDKWMPKFVILKLKPKVWRFFKSNVIYLSHLIRKDDKKGLYWRILGTWNITLIRTIFFLQHNKVTGLRVINE